MSTITKAFVHFEGVCFHFVGNQFPCLWTMFSYPSTRTTCFMLNFFRIKVALPALYLWYLLKTIDCWTLVKLPYIVQVQSVKTKNNVQFR